MSTPSSSSVSIDLSPDEALVLFEFLQRFSDSGTLAIQDQAEERVLWNLCCLLEKRLVTPFESRYDVLLREARDRLRDKE